MPQTGGPDPVPAPTGYNFNFSGISPFIEALSKRWNDVMDVQTSRLRQQPARDDAAFKEWQLGKQEGRIRRADQDAQEYSANEYAKKAAEDAAIRAAAEKRMRLASTVDAAHALNMAYGGAQPWTPAGAVNDFNTYGPDAPGGRGGGAGSHYLSDAPDVMATNAGMDERNCRANPTGPGCPGHI